MDYELWQKSSLIEYLNMKLIKDLLDQNNLDFVTEKNVYVFTRIKKNNKKNNKKIIKK